MEEQVQRIQNKAAALLRQYHLLLEEVSLLKKEKNALEEQLAEKVSELKSLELANANHRQGDTSLNTIQKEELEKKLNHYIKEIDQCISTLKQ